MSTLYSILLPIHSILRWLVLLFGLFALIRALTGMRFRRPFEQMDDRAGLFYTISLDIQLLVGLILYFFASPTTTGLLTGSLQVSGNPPALFFGIEHVTIMFVAVVLAHVGRSIARKSAKAARKLTDRAKAMPLYQRAHRNTAIFFALSLVAILLGIPWPFLPGIGRPLIRF